MAQYLFHSRGQLYTMSICFQFDIKHTTKFMSISTQHADAKYIPKTKKKKAQQNKRKSKQQNRSHNHEHEHDHNLFLLVQSLTNRVLNVGELSELQLV